jgi:hypothetical protein
MTRLFFEVISILLIAFYSSPQFLINYQSSQSNQSFFRIDSGNPIVYHKASEHLSYVNSQPKIQLVGYEIWAASCDMPSAEITTNKALLVVDFLRNVFYVFVSINAP